MDLKLEKQDFTAIRKHCEKISRITARVIDNYLIGFAARRHDFGRQVNREFAAYRHVLSRFERPNVEMFKSQYITHKIFKEGGLLGKFMKNPALSRFTGEEREYLENQVQVPWRYSFSLLTDEPAKDFFRMTDIFTDEEYILFSPGTTRLKASGPPLTWLNLIGYNGQCWQSYGPIGAFNAFGPEDIFFFATEMNPAIEEPSEVQKDIEANPLPFLLLFSGAAYPRTFSQEHEGISLMSEYDSEMPDTAILKDKFISEYNRGVYRFTHRTIGEFPHMAHCYYDENKGMQLFHAMTEAGFDRLISDFNSFGYNFPPEAYQQVRIQMKMTAESILKKNIVLNEYDELFHKDPDPDTEDDIKKTNKFLELILPAVNDGRKPDMESAARLAGLDSETAREIADIVINQTAKVIKKKAAEPPKPQAGAPYADLMGRMYTSLSLIGAMEPWERLYETDIFGVRIPGSGVTWFISIMGNNGEYTGISAYRDYEGLMGFLNIQENHDRLPVTTVLTIPHIRLSFTDREELDKRDMEAVKRSGVTFRGRGQWPKLEETLPGYVPAFPDQEMMEEIADLFEQVLMTLVELQTKPTLLNRKGTPDNELLIRVTSGTGAKRKWKNSYELIDTEGHRVEYNLSWSRESQEAVIKLKPSEDRLQCELFLVPAPVMNPGKRDYLPFMLLLTDKNSGMISGMELIHADPDIRSVYESVPQKLLDLIKKLGRRPAVIEFRSDLLYSLAEELLDICRCSPSFVENMPLMDEAIDALLESLGK